MFVLHNAPQQEPDDSAIRYDGFTKSFGPPESPFVAVADVNLEIRRGEFVTIVGPSGCGKSTLLNAAAGLYEPTSGAVFYDGKPVTRINTRVGYMTQSDHLLPWRTAARNIEVPLEIRGESRSARARRLAELIELVGLSGSEHAYPSQLSGGMRKRCVLARLLAYDPDTLLLDEPFSALDAQLRLQMQIELRRLCRTLNKTVAFVTHDIDEAVALGDRCVVFSRRPGTIRAIIDIDLPRDRNLMSIRKNARYHSLSATVWDLLVEQGVAS